MKAIIRNSTLLCLLATVLLALEKKPLISESPAPRALDLLTRMTEFYKQQGNFVVSYDQKVKNKSLDQDSFVTIQSRGEYARIRKYDVKRKHWTYLARWSIKTPVYYEIYTNHKTFWFYNPLAHLVQTQDYASLPNKATVFLNDLLMGKISAKSLTKSFVVSLSPKHKYIVELKPEASHQSAFVMIEFKIHPINSWLETVTIERPDGITSIDFHSMKAYLPKIPDLERRFNKNNDFLKPQSAENQ